MLCAVRNGGDPQLLTEDRLYGGGGSYQLCVVGGRNTLHIAYASNRPHLISKFETLGVSNSADLNGCTPRQLNPLVLDDHQAVRDRILQAKQTTDRDAEMLELFGKDVRQLFLPREEWEISQTCPGVFIVRCFDDDVRIRINDFIERMAVDAPNSMSSYGRRLVDTSIDYLITRNLDVINEMIATSFPPSAASRMKQHYTFSIGYKVGEDDGLGAHTDRSAFTLNVCLTSSCEGSEVYFVNDAGEWHALIQIASTHSIPQMRSSKSRIKPGMRCCI